MDKPNTETDRSMPGNGVRANAPAPSQRSGASKASVTARLPVRRGLSEVEAAVYLSLSPSFFRRLVDQAIMPRPRVIGGRRIYDVEELDAAFKALPREGGEAAAAFGAASGNSWTDFE